MSTGLKTDPADYNYPHAYVLTEIIMIDLV